MITIATFNIKNNYNNYKLDKAQDIYKFIKNNDIDILCMQELFSKCLNDLKEIINDSQYKLCGKFRYHWKIFTPINESVSILTKLNLLNYKTYNLPFLPSTLKRVATRALIETEYGKIVVINTHLDYKFELAKKRQLNKLINIIKIEKYPVIVTGDFNLKNNNSLFNDFTKNMKNLGLNRVDINEKTLKQSNYNRAIDHIFIPNNFYVKEKIVVKNLEISDHYPILVKLEQRKNYN